MVRVWRHPNAGNHPCLSLTYSTAALVNPSVVEAELAHRDEIRLMREAAQEAESARREEKDKERRLAREQEEVQKRRIWAQARLVGDGSRKPASSWKTCGPSSAILSATVRANGESGAGDL
jgi:hypothetical protein